MNRKFTVIKEGSLYEGKASTPEVFKIDGVIIARTFEYKQRNSTFYNFSWDLAALQKIFGKSFEAGEYSKDWNKGIALLNNKKALCPVSRMEVELSIEKALK